MLIGIVDIVLTWSNKFLECELHFNFDSDDLTTQISEE